MSDPMDLNRRPREERGAASKPLVIAAAVALAIVAGLFVVYSYRGSERMDDTAAVQGTATAPMPNARRPETSGSNVPPAAAPSPNR